MQSQSQSLPLLPATYHTTNQTRNGISLAYSNFHNPPGLEKMWNAPWLGTLNSLVERYDGLFTVHSEYPMFIPSLIIKDLNLRRRFEDNGMDYHDIDDGCSSDDSEGDQEDSLMLSETHQSARILSLQSRAVRSEEKRRKDVEKALRKERAQLRLEQAQAKDEGKSLFPYANNNELLLQLQQCFARNTPTTVQLLCQGTEPKTRSLTLW